MRLRKYLREGTWSVPYTLEAAKKLEKIMQNPLKGKDGKDKIYGLTGNDSLFDHISDDDPDIRRLVADQIMMWVKQWEQDMDSFKDNFDHHAIPILKKLYLKYGSGTNKYRIEYVEDTENEMVDPATRYWHLPDEIQKKVKEEL